MNINKSAISSKSVMSPPYECLMKNQRKIKADSISEVEELHAFFLAVDQSPASTIILDNERTIIYVNPACVQITGYSANELIGKPIDILRSDLHPPEYYKLIWPIVLSGKVWRGDVCSKRKNGENVWELISLSPLKLEGGEIVGFLSVRLDDTERREAEKKLRRAYGELEATVKERTEELVVANQSLVESQKYLDIAQEIAHLGHWKLDIETNELIASDEFLRILGLSREEATFQSFIEVIDPKDRELSSEMFKKGIEDGENWDFEYRLKCKDGKEKIIHAVGNVVTNEAGKTIQIVGTAQDVTEQKLVEDKLKELMYIDEVTGIANRRCYQKTIKSEWNRAKRKKAPISVIMVDIDYFKQYNDTYGHSEGDDCIRYVAQTLHTLILRAGDLLARYGGEEFVVVLPGSDKDTATKLAVRLRKKIESLRIEHSNSSISKYVTISLGVATLIPGKDEESNTLVSTADRALYSAKAEGRNCVKVSEL